MTDQALYNRVHILSSQLQLIQASRNQLETVINGDFKLLIYQNYDAAAVTKTYT